jgi:hypothetical protein
MKNCNFISFIGAIVAKILKSKKIPFVERKTEKLMVTGLRARNPRRV